MKKLKPRDILKFSWIMIATGLIIGLVGALINIAAISFTGVGIMIISIILRLIFFRCPHCGKFLDRSTGDFCPDCGENVNE